MSSVRANYCGSAQLIAIMAAAVIACWTRGARADDFGCVGMCAETGRTLGGHRHVPFSIVDWGFIQTEFGITSSVGELRLDDRLTTRATSDDSSRLKFLAIGQTFSGAAAVNPWLGLRIRATGSSVMVISTARETPVAIGSQALLGAEVGAVVRLYRDRILQLSARGDVTWARNFTPELLPGDPRVDRDIWTIRPAFVAAISVAPTVGVQASASYELRDVEGQEDRVHRVAVGAGVSFELDPVMLLVGGRYAHESERAEDRRIDALTGRGGNQWSGELGLFYHGRSDLDLGTAFVLGVADDDRRYLGHIRMNYYF